MAFIGVQVSDEMKAAFDALAGPQGGQSALLRRMLESVTGQVDVATSRSRVVGGTSEKITVRFRRAERAAIADAAAARGMTRTQWITSLVRARLSLGLPLTGGEEQALRAVARELNRMGGNVNQIARAANMQALAGKPVELDAAPLQELGGAVRAAAAELRDALARSAASWQVPV